MTRNSEVVYSKIDLIFIGTTYYILPILSLFFFGIWHSVLYLSAVYACKRILTEFVLGLDPLNTVDEFFLLDWEKNRSNIMTMMQTTKIENYDEFRRFLVNKITKFRRTRSRLVKYLHEYYFEELHGEDLQKAINKAFVMKELGSMKEVCEFMA